MVAAERSTLARRSLGIGYIGLAHFLAKNKVKYDKRLEPYPLRFNFSDVEYIYVTSPEEKIRVVSEFGFIEKKVKLSCWK